MKSPSWVGRLADGAMDLPQRRIVLVVLAVAAVTLPWWGSGSLVDVLTIALLHGFLASAWNIVGGLAGQLSVGHAGFFGIGAYGVAFLYARLGITPYVGILAGLSVAVIGASVLGYMSFWLPFGGFTFLLLTLGFAELLRAVARTVEIFGGAEGLMFPFNPGLTTLQFRQGTPYYFIVLGMVAGILIITKRIRNGSFGLRLESIREDEGAAVAAGIPATRLKLAAFVISAALTSLGGAFYAVLFSFITPDKVFSIDFSVAMITGSLIGGRGTVWGPVVGGALLWSLTEAMVRLPLGSGLGANIAIMLNGLALIVIVHRLPKGIAPGLSGEFVRGHLEGGILLSRLRAASRMLKNSEPVGPACDSYE